MWWKRQEQTEEIRKMQQVRDDSVHDEKERRTIVILFYWQIRLFGSWLEISK